MQSVRSVLLPPNNLSSYVKQGALWSDLMSLVLIHFLTFSVALVSVSRSDPPAEPGDLGLLRGPADLQVPQHSWVDASRIPQEQVGTVLDLICLTRAIKHMRP